MRRLAGGGAWPRSGPGSSQVPCCWPPWRRPPRPRRAAARRPSRPRSAPASTLVALDLVVRDRGGNAIRDLRPDEVEVYEDGVRQPVTEFRAVARTARARRGAGANGSGPRRAPGSSPTGRAGPPRADRRRAGRGARARASSRSCSTSSRSRAGRSREGGPRAARAPARPGRVRGDLPRRRPAEAGPKASRASAAPLLESVDARDARQRAGLRVGRRRRWAPRSAPRATAATRCSGGYDTRELRPAHSAGDREAGTPMDGDGPARTRSARWRTSMLDILRTAEEVERTQRGNRSLDGAARGRARTARRCPAARPSSTSPRGSRSRRGSTIPSARPASEANRAERLHLQRRRARAARRRAHGRHAIAARPGRR